MTYVLNEQTNKWEVHFTQQQHAFLTRMEEQEKKLKELLKKKLDLNIDVKHNKKENRKDKNGNDSYRTVELNRNNGELRTKIVFIQFYLLLINRHCQEKNDKKKLRQRDLYKKVQAEQWYLNTNTLKKQRALAVKEFENCHQQMKDFKIPDFEEEL